MQSGPKGDAIYPASGPPPRLGDTARRNPCRTKPTFRLHLVSGGALEIGTCKAAAVRVGAGP